MDKSAQRVEGPLPISTIEVEEGIQRAVAAIDLASLSRSYWDQHEFIFLDRFIPNEIVDRCLSEAEQLRSQINRNFVPGHKQGGSVSFYTILSRAPALLALYRSSALLMFLSQIVKESLMLCPENDPHSCALYYYTKPGDHIGFHYDTSYYKGKRYTVLIGLVERSQHCRLMARVHMGQAGHQVRETRIPMEPGSTVIFNGDKLWHAVTPLGNGEERIVLTLQYVTNQEIGPFKKLFSNLKDAVAYFGPAALWSGPKRGTGRYIKASRQSPAH